MKFEVTRDVLLDPLLAVQGVVERRQTSPILANVLLRIDEGVLSVTATDNEIELVAEAELDGVDPGDHRRRTGGKRCISCAETRPCIDGQEIGSERGDLGVEVRATRFGQSEYRDHRRDANGDAERGERAAESPSSQAR